MLRNQRVEPPARSREWGQESRSRTGLPCLAVALSLSGCATAGGTTAGSATAGSATADTTTAGRPTMQSDPTAGAGGGGRLLVVGDTQRTLWAERWLLFRESNPRARIRLRDEMLGQNGSALLHLGDAVAMGSSRGDWADFDAWLAPLVSAGLSVHAVRGNHDEFGDRANGLAEWSRRFPGDWRQTFWASSFGGMRILGLDSNLKRDTPEELAQRRWFQKELQSDADAVIVASHIPPFTNSPLGLDSALLREKYVPAFCKVDKALLWLSGHAHGYEHFAGAALAECGSPQPRSFLISAGGGGPRPASLRSGAKTGWVDSYQGAAPRPFNFLVLERDGSSLTVRSHGFSDFKEPLRELETLRLPLALR